MTEVACPFCLPAPERIFHLGDLVIGLWDAFPVSPGHALLVLRRHIPGWWDASPKEQQDLIAALEIARQEILKKHKPDGFNIGWNIGVAAGQTVLHLHVHIIPRYAGDVADPRGGIRHVVPGKANYLAVAATESLSELQLPHHQSLVRGGDDPFLPHLLANLDRARNADVAVAFVLETGVRALIEHLRDLLDRGGQLRLIAGDYLGVTEPDALAHLLDMAGAAHLRVYEAEDESFHPKSYIFHHSDGSGTAYVGSSNLSRTALGAGIEWNYRVVSSRDADGYKDVTAAFQGLFYHSRTRPLTREWVDAYRRRRRTPVLIAESGVSPTDKPPPPPRPHAVQEEALAALVQTRIEGNQAGLVVLATGLGKTWLAAFDSDRPEYRRVLFVAHRDEILTQALETFRRIRPQASLGRYTGVEKAPEADVLFASVQTLGKLPHLRLFDPDAFDYVVVDEFHHAAAQTYRRLLKHFSPRFLLGLTATPERADGGDLLALCQENLVYRCDLADGIQRGLLCPFHYFGVPDTVDYTNIPWRSSRFDEEALTQAVATQTRAENILEQYRKRAGQRTLAFCCSQAHADFMARFFSGAGLRAVAVHAGPQSAPRAASLERLESGKLDIVCAVDMFNEGVDLPHVDTVMMLRPTESRVVWLQQLGRGLRKATGKEHLTVIDYIGNHRAFLLKVQTLLDLGASYQEVARALDQISANQITLPPGCTVTYDLVVMDILRDLLPRQTAGGALVEAYYNGFKERHGERPLAVEAFHDGYNPRTLRTAAGSWLRFVDSKGDLAPGQKQTLEDHGDFLSALEKTPMTRSFKVLTLQAMLQRDALPGALEISQLTAEFARIAGRSATLKADVGVPLEDATRLRKYLEMNPLAAWTEGKGTGGNAYFSYTNGLFRSTFDVSLETRETFKDLVSEILDWRLAEYLQRHAHQEEGFIGRVTHSAGRPIILLPDRRKAPELPHGLTNVIVDGEPYECKFVKIALNVMTQPGEKANVLPEVLRRWFGSDAGKPGTAFQVVFRQENEHWTMAPQGDTGEAGPP